MEKKSPAELARIVALEATNNRAKTLHAICQNFAKVQDLFHGACLEVGKLSKNG